MKPAVAPGAGRGTHAAPLFWGEAFSQRAAALLGARLVACQERFPDGPAGCVIVVTVDCDAEVWQPRLAEMHAALFAGREPSEPPRLEVLDCATAQALERLEAAGLIRTCVRAFAWSKTAGFLAVVGAVLAAAYMLRLLKQIVWGREDKRTIRDMNLREVIYLFPLGVFVIWIGLFPRPLVRMMENTLGHLLWQLQVFSH